MIRHIAADVYQIGECIGSGSSFEAVRVYVLLNNGHPVLIDCGSQLHRQGIMSELKTLLEGQTPDYIFLTHSELPHAGNLHSIAKRWPDIKVIVSNIMLPYIEIAPILPLSQITTANAGSTLEVAGRKLEFVDALLKDQPGSQWIFDTLSGTLFTGDGFGYYVTPETCDSFSDEIGGISEEQFRSYHRMAFRFLRWVVPERINADLDKLFKQYPIQILAPIHGNAIRSDIQTHLDNLKQAIVHICHDTAWESS